MAIDLTKNFLKHEKELTQLLSQQKDDYYKSKCFERLRGRYFRLRDSIDMNFNSDTRNRSRNNTKNNFQSKIAFAIVKVRALLRDAIIRQNYRGNPFITLEAVGSTIQENAVNATDLLNQNFKTTKFRAKCFKWATKDVSEYGSSVIYTSWRESNKTAKKTVDTRLGIQREDVKTTKKNALNTTINILDFFMNPNITDPDDSDYIGHIERMNLAKFKGLMKMSPEVYIKKNVQWVIKQSELGSLDDQHYHTKYDRETKGERKFNLDRNIFYSTCNIKGNEDNQDYYYIEMVAGKIVRFQINPHDDDMRPYGVLTFYPRREYWWGNSDAEFVLPHEKYTNLIMSMKADNALRSQQQYFFYEKGSIDTADWNNRRKNGGMIGVNTKQGQNLSQILYQTQPKDFSLNETDSIMREVKENQQSLTPSPDLSRSAKSGGPQNVTATAALILEEQGDVSEALILENLNFGIEKVGENNTVMLQQRLADKFALRPKATEEQKILAKQEVLGNFGYNVQTSLNKNKASELLRLERMLTSIMNYKGTQDPVFQQLNVVPLVQKIIKAADIGDVEDILPTPQLPAGGVPSQALLGQEQAGAAQDLTQPQTQEGALNAA